MHFKSSFFCLLSSLIILTSCEQEGDALTLEELLNATKTERLLFEAFIDGEKFISQNAKGSKVGNQIVIIAANEKGQFSFNLPEVEPDLYTDTSGINVKINYVTADGKQFLSKRSNFVSDAEILISFYNEDENKINGSFSAFLYNAQNEKEKIKVNGVFNQLFVDIPFLGKMRAILGASNFRSNQCTYKSTTTGQIVLDEIIATSLDDSTRISISIEGEVEVKQYDFQDTKVNALYNSNVFSFNTPKYQYNSTSGNLIVTLIDTIENKLKGTFYFDSRNGLGEIIKIEQGTLQALIK